MIGRIAKILPRGIVASVLAGAALLLPIAAHSAVKPVQPDVSRPHVYLMRGLLNIFSLGMDQLATQIAQRGVEATVYNHSVEESVVGEIAQKYRAGDHGPYILIGHSLGADAVMMMAQQLNAAGVPVALVVPFDGTGFYTASQNVACVLNITQRYYAYMRPGTGFHGKLRNVDASSDPTIDHLNIDKSPRLQGLALDAVLHAAHAQSCKPDNAPAVAHAKEPSKTAHKDTPAPKPSTPSLVEHAPAEPTKSALTEPALRL
jgi:hypothetical protein